MVKIFNTHRGADPLAQTIANLGKSLFGDNTANAINNEKLYAAQRENTEMDNLMRRIGGGGGAQALGADPIAQAILVGSGYDPSKFGDLGLMGAANEFGARDPRTQNWQVGTGQSFDNTAGAFDAKLAETARSNDMASADRRYGTDQTRAQQMHEFNYEPQPVITSSGAPGYVPRSEMTRTNVAPIMSETDQKGRLLGENFDNLPNLNPMQRQVLGANPSETGRSPKNYILPDGKSFITYDGVTDAQSGQPLPGGGFIGNVEGAAGDVGLTNSTTSGLQQGNIAYDKFMSVVKMAEPLTQDPTLFGLQGAVRSKAQDIYQSLGGIEAVATAKRDLEATLGGENAAALIPEFYDPRLGEVEALWGILLYNGASALAGQENRSVSDQDVKKMRNILGDPHSLFASNLSMKTKLDTATRLVEAGRRVNDQYLTGGAQPAQQPAPSATPQVERWERDPASGQLRRVQ